MTATVPRLPLEEQIAKVRPELTHRAIRISLPSSATSASPFSSVARWEPRPMSWQARKRAWRERSAPIDALAKKGVLIRGHSYRDVAEEAPGAYKDVEKVVEAADRAGLASKVAKLVPFICIKG